MDDQRSEEKINDEGTQNSDNKKGGLFKNLGSTMKSLGEKTMAGATKLGQKVKQGFQNIEEKIEESAAKKELQKKIEHQFNATATKYTVVIPGEKTKYFSVLLQTNYNNKTLILYGENKKITNNCFFIDSAKQKFTIEQIRLNQTADIKVDNTIYSKPVTVYDYSIKNDDETKKEMQTIINNVTISDSTITKSNIG